MDAFDDSFFEKLLSSEECDFCDCPMPAGKFPKETPLAMAYVPFQCWEKPYDQSTAFARATIFPSLDKPFIGEEALKNVK